MANKVKMTLVGVGGNAFAVMGTFRCNALKQGWTPAEVDKVLDEAKSKDYAHLLATIFENIDDSESNSDSED